MSKKDFFMNLDTTLGDEFNVPEAFQLVKYDFSVYMSWGATAMRPMNLLNRGLLIKVNGYKHKGFVLVDYRRVTDVYRVTLLSGQYNVKHVEEEVYCDELQEVIDNLVEKQPEYKEISKPKFG